MITLRFYCNRQLSKSGRRIYTENDNEYVVDFVRKTEWDFIVMMRKRKGAPQGDAKGDKNEQRKLEDTV